MANTLDYYKQLSYNSYAIERDAAGLPVDDPALWSIYSIKRLYINIIAFVAFCIDGLLDTVRTDTTDELRTQKPHLVPWYAGKAKIFQYGFPLLGETEYFDNTGYTDQQIAESFIVNYSAVVEQENIATGRLSLRVKLAHFNGTDLEPLDQAQLDAFTVWFKTKIRDAGVKVSVESLPADAIKQQWRIYYDPLILGADGSRLDGQENTPVQDAIANYLTNLPFNGIYVTQYHVDAVQQVPGVVICEMLNCNVRYGNLPFAPVNTLYTPDAGYLRFYDRPNDLQVSFIPQSAIK